MKVNVIGLGYIGLPTALMMAAHGVEVYGADLDEGRVALLQSGQMPFSEKGMDELLAAARAGGIRFGTVLEEAEAYIISVPTPYDSVSKRVDARFVAAAVGQVVEACPSEAILVIESTVSPGTIDRCVRPIVERAGVGRGKTVELVHAPERVLPGNMVYEMVNNSRTIGADNPAVGERVRQCYASFCKAEIVVTDIRTAEMTKVVENTFRAVNIAFANELMRICRQDGMDVYEIIRICNKHPRVNILQPGPGVGGHCISVDPWFLVGDYPSLTKVIGESMRTNASQPEFVLRRIGEVMEVEGIGDPSRVGLYGLTYKEDVDDVRESPALQLLDCQRGHLAVPLLSYDPLAPAGIAPRQQDDFDRFLEAVDMVVVMVKHSHLKQNWDKLAGKVVLDCQNFCPLAGTHRL